MKIYPVILFAYNRPEHTRLVLEALKKNQLAGQTELFVFIDGPRATATASQKKDIDEVLKVVESEQWCKNVVIRAHQQNIGCRNSIIQGITTVLSQHEAAIILEDDIVTSPHFLNFMNKCLNFYRDYPAVFSISGLNLEHNKIQIPDDYKYDVYVSLRQFNSGWATWSDRWNKINWNKDTLKEFLTNPVLCDAYSRGGDDLIPMLYDEIEGRSDAWDVQFTFNQFKHHGVSIIPIHSYVDNIGGDGTGTHHTNSGEFLRFNIEKAIPEPRLLDILYEDKRLINAFYNAYSRVKRPLWKKIINRISRIITGSNVFIIKKKIYH
jgi:GR25 family glycosyltransferase involved in LPS biosynthesis